METKKINAFISEVMNSIPDGMKAIPEEMQTMFKTAMLSTLNKMDIVTREEFDIQSKVLARTREKLEALEKQVAELEK